MNSEIILSLLSGLVGVIVGSFIQIAYTIKFDKKKTSVDYIKLICTEWLGLSAQAQELLNNPAVYNHMIFNLHIKEKANLLSYIMPFYERDTVKSRQISKLQALIKDKGEEFSLDPRFEGALTKGENEGDKRLFLVELTNFINDIHEKLTEIARD